MRFLRKTLSMLLAMCMVFSMVLPAAAVEDALAPEGNRIVLNKDEFADVASVWVDGVEYPVIVGNSACYVSLPEDANPGSMVTYSFYVGDASDVHTQYPTGMKVWALKAEDEDTYVPNALENLENILQYSGSSIRITGTKGIRMITSIEQAKKQQLTTAGIDGYKLLEYGTLVSWASDLEGGKPMILGQEYSKSNFAYKKDEADPVFKYEGNLMQYTNVLVGFSLEQCAPDICMRSYMILEDEEGQQITLYGGIVTRSIGYIAWQNRYVFNQGTASYDYVWEIIRAVYGDISEVRFNTNGGTPVEAVTVPNGQPMAKPADPAKDGLTFDGWYTDRNLTQKYDFSSDVTDCMILYAGWSSNGRPVKPENPSAADEYYWETSEVIDVIKVNESEDIHTETDVKTLLESRGFGAYPITYSYNMNGDYIGETAVTGSANRYPMYQSYYLSEEGAIWSIFVINGAVMAYPASFNLESELDVEVLVSETETITSYDDTTGTYYVTIPYDSTILVKTVDRIDAETLDRLTIEELSKL